MATGKPSLSAHTAIFCDACGMSVYVDKDRQMTRCPGCLQELQGIVGPCPDFSSLVSECANRSDLSIPLNEVHQYFMGGVPYLVSQLEPYIGDDEIYFRYIPESQSTVVFLLNESRLACMLTKNPAPFIGFNPQYASAGAYSVSESTGNNWAYVSTEAARKDIVKLSEDKDFSYSIWDRFDSLALHEERRVRISSLLCRALARRDRYNQELKASEENPPASGTPGHERWVRKVKRLKGLIVAADEEIRDLNAKLKSGQVWDVPDPEKRKPKDIDSQNPLSTDTSFKDKKTVKQVSTTKVQDLISSVDVSNLALDSFRPKSGAL